MSNRFVIRWGETYDGDIDRLIVCDMKHFGKPVFNAPFKPHFYLDGSPWLLVTKVVDALNDATLAVQAAELEPDGLHKLAKYYAEQEL